MKSKATCISVLVRFVMFSVFVSGCTESQMTNTSANDPVVKDTIAKKVHVIDVQSYQRGAELVISGRVKRSYNFCCDDAKGHIDIVVVDPAVIRTAYHSNSNFADYAPGTRTLQCRLNMATPGIDAL